MRLNVEWDGSTEVRISLVDLEWRRRRFTQASPTPVPPTGAELAQTLRALRPHRRAAPRRLALGITKLLFVLFALAVLALVALVTWCRASAEDIVSGTPLLTPTASGFTVTSAGPDGSQW